MAPGWIQGAIGALVSLQVLGGGWALATLSDPPASPPAHLDDAPAGSLASLPAPVVDRTGEVPSPPRTVAEAQEPTQAPPPPPAAPEPPMRSTTTPPRAAIDVTPLGDLLRGLLPPLIGSHKRVL